MSRSSLWTMDKEFHGEEVMEFSNSWLFSPIVWDTLFQKYLPHEVNGPHGKTTYMTATSFNPQIFRDLNEKVNDSDNNTDRILWELSNQQIFFTKDKDAIVKAIREFLTMNSSFTGEMGEHIFERFQEVANEIVLLDKETSPYFIFKCTSVDDAVEYWFRKYDEEEEEYFDSPLKELESVVAEFVIMNDSNIKEFVTNVEFFHGNPKGINR